MRDMRAHDIDMLTIGQYLAPSGHHLPVRRYVHPDTFKMFEAEAYKMGFTHARSRDGAVELPRGQAGRAGARRVSATAGPSAFDRAGVARTSLNSAALLDAVSTFSAGQCQPLPAADQQVQAGRACQQLRHGLGQSCCPVTVQHHQHGRSPRDARQQGVQARRGLLQRGLTRGGVQGLDVLPGQRFGLDLPHPTRQAGRHQLRSGLHQGGRWCRHRGR